MKHDPKRFFIVTIATHDGRANIKALESCFLIATELAQMGLKDRYYFNVAIGHGIAMVRTAALDTLSKLFKGDEVWTLWLDSDVQINENPRVIAEYIAEAEKTGKSWAAATRTLMGSDSSDGYFKTNAFRKREDGTIGTYSEDELQKARPFELKLIFSGLALCYIKTPLAYRFHNEGVQNEDVNFYKDNPQVDLRYCSVDNTHDKTIALEWKRKTSDLAEDKKIIEK